MSPEDLDAAARTVLAEAGGTGIPGMAAVANVIKNRAVSGKWGDSVSDVVTAKHQFEPWAHAGTGRNNDPLRFDPNSSQYRQAVAIVQGVASGEIPDITKGATHFYAPTLQADLGRNSPAWANGQTPTARIGGHVFYNPNGTDGGPADPSQALALASKLPSAGDTPAGQAIDAAAPPAPAPTMAGGPPAAPAAPGAAPGKVPPPSANPMFAMLQGLMGPQGGGGGAGQPAQGGTLARMLFGDGGLHGALGRIPTPNDGRGLFGGLFGVPGRSPAGPAGAPVDPNAGTMAQGLTPPGMPGTPGGGEIPMPHRRPDEFNPPSQVAQAPGPMGTFGQGIAPPGAMAQAGGGNPLSGLMSMFGLG